MVRVVQKVPFPRPSSSSWLRRVVVGKGHVYVCKGWGKEEFPSCNENGLSLSLQERS